MNCSDASAEVSDLALWYDTDHPSGRVLDFQNTLEDHETL